MIRVKFITPHISNFIRAWPFINKGGFMFSITKLKWYGSIALAGILLVLAMVGGTWGTSYAADGVLNEPPVINYIDPHSLPAGTPDHVMIIVGSEFGEAKDEIRIWIKGIDSEYLLEPLFVTNTAISVTLPAEMLAVPNTFIVSVIKSKIGTIPTIPTVPDPLNDHVSNSVPFEVFEAIYSYLPIINK